ncbi:mechanosensitive ion channel [Lysobacter sp. H21R4]|uniref:mechanosensitive ion channel family protein n=1 Tax=Lysobacter sp. H21R4 TaxID=2781021 RepID=UPI0018875604|nr:mechanosensitive ion channel family protein [Lysobacter sp. H21R4]QOY63762.1 mechanosensitive ion channel [Lysobacter sp. H21R4]
MPRSSLLPLALLAALLVLLLPGVAPASQDPGLAQLERPAAAEDSGAAERPGTDPDAIPDAEAAAPDDDALTLQVARRLQKADGMQDVNVTVTAGVARLEGSVLEVEDRTLAEQIASQHPGISAVENHLTLSTHLIDRLDAASAIAMDKVFRLLAALPLLIVAVAMVVASWWLGRWLGVRIGKHKLRTANPYINGLARNLVQWLVLIVGVLSALNLLGATSLLGAVLGSAGVIGLVVGFAFKDIAENYVAGVLLGLRRPFSPGDTLRIDTYEGKVVALTSRATILMTLDGNRLSLPNALVFKSVVLNFSSNPKRRFDFVIPVDAASSMGTAQETGLERIASIDGVLADPRPSSIINSYDGNELRIHFFGWIDQRKNDLGGVRSAAIRAVRNGFFLAGIQPPRSIQHVVAMPAPDQATAIAEPSPAEAVAMDESPDTAPQDTSINRDIDEQLADEQRAHSPDDLMSPDP